MNMLYWHMLTFLHGFSSLETTNILSDTIINDHCRKEYIALDNGFKVRWCYLRIVLWTWFIGYQRYIRFILVSANWTFASTKRMGGCHRRTVWECSPSEVLFTSREKQVIHGRVSSETVSARVWGLCIRQRADGCPGEDVPSVPGALG